MILKTKKNSKYAKGKVFLHLAFFVSSSELFKFMTNKITLEAAHLRGVQNTLRALSPQGTLERGFAIVRTSNGQIVKRSDSVTVDEDLRIRFAEGEIDVKRTS